MLRAVTTELWQRSLGQALPEREEEQSRRLITSLESFYERADLLGKEIARDLPDFTVHDASHADALWVLADRIAGPDFTLTPTEAYVFGGSCLIHDLGMASAAYVDGRESVREEPRWSDAVALALRGELGRLPSRDEIAAPGMDVLRAAQERVLRELHAEKAERLAMTSWTDERGEQQRLIEDSLLREAYAPIIGQIAHSHWWATDALNQRFVHSLGAPAGFPPAWTVRPLIVACLLRLADASHIDASRAPRFLRVVRRPAAGSSPHWEFQAHLAQPYVEGDRFVFTGSPFTIEQAEAWWLCADTVRMVDREFRAVDALLADRRVPRLAVRGVAGGSDLNRLTTYIPTDGWTPLDARVRVSNVVRLVKRLGGRELYGENPHVPLRELVQNASDAVRARRTIEGRAGDWGEIVVRLGATETDGQRWLEVEDTGVGMSPAVLTDHLLDFGTSFWDSERVLEELPGLLAAAFEPVGQFGIGFFSIFMWGDAVTVTSRKHDAGQAETHVLEFTGGVSQRPLLRMATLRERLVEPGTRVRVRLSEDLGWRLGLRQGTTEVTVLADLCQWLAPALDVNLQVEAEGERLTAVAANDWLRMPIDELGDRLRQVPIRRGPRPSPEEEAVARQADAEAAERGEEVDAEEEASMYTTVLPSALVDHVRPLTLSDGTVVGRALLNPLDYWGGVVAVGGFRAAPLRGTTGIMVGHPTTASRHVGIPVAPVEVVAEWATEQATLLAGKLAEEPLLDAAERVWMCGGDTGPLPVIVTCRGPLTRAEVIRWASELDEVVLLQDAALSNEERSGGSIDLQEAVAAVSMTPLGIVEVPLGENDPPAEYWPPLEAGHRRGGLAGAVIEAVADAWDVPIAELLEAYAQAGMESRVIGQRDGADIVLHASVLSRLES